jgi:purine-nucleoside phosphorylase
MPGRIDEVEAADAIRRQWPARPRVGIILGTGLGGLAEHISVEASTDFASIPHFPRATALGHRGRCVCGTLAGARVVAMDGRLHAYEGHCAAQVALSVRIMSALGVDLLILSNACGGVNPDFRPGDIMIVEDHVNLTWDNPLVGPHDAPAEPGYPDMSRPYDPRLIESALAIARRRGFTAHRGVYVGVMGPNYETRAEYRFLRRIGGDAVGMSTVPELIVAVERGLRVLALSVVTNVALPDRLQATDANEVVAVAAAAEPNVRAIVLGIIEQESRVGPAEGPRAV